MDALIVSYRPDEYPDWIRWKGFTSDKLKLIGNPGALEANGVPSAHPGFYPRLSLGKPSNTCDPTTKRITRRGYMFQVKFNGTGHFIIDRFRLHAQKLVERATANNTP